MRPIDRSRTRRGLIAMAVAVSFLLALTPAAHAEPTTTERRRVAEEVAASVCSTVPTIPKLRPSVDPRKLCQQVLVENIDPEGNNAGVYAACQLSLPGSATAAVKYCTKIIDKLLDPA